jgi:WD40 repeat protein
MSSKAAQSFPYLRWQEAMSPQYTINSTAISADGSRCVAATFQGAYGTSPPPSTDTYCVSCWDRVGKLEWSDSFEAFEGVFACAISGDGKVAAAGGWIEEGKGFATVYDAKTGEKLITYNFTHRVNTLTLSYDGSALAIGENDVHLAQQKNGVFPTTLSSANLSGSIIESVSMTSDGSAFVAGDYSGNVYMFANNNGTLSNVGTWAGGSDMGPVHCVAISTDGAWFVAAGDSTSLYLFDLTSIKAKQTAASIDLKDSDRLRWVTISADGSYIATCGNQGNGGLVYAIKNDSGKLSTIWNQAATTTLNPNCVSTDAAGKYVAVATGYTPTEKGGEFCLFDGATGASLWSLPTPLMNWPCFISADGSGMFGGSDYGDVYYFIPNI